MRKMSLKKLAALVLFSECEQQHNRDSASSGAIYSISDLKLAAPRKTAYVSRSIKLELKITDC